MHLPLITDLAGIGEISVTGPGAAKVPAPKPLLADLLADLAKGLGDQLANELLGGSE